MGLRIRRLKIVIETEKQRFGTDIQFNDGLVIIRADNTSGKSTCIRSIIYTLGLERALGPATSPPLTPAVLSKIKYNESEVQVLESNLYLEIENSENRIITVKRKAAGADNQERKLVTVWEGASLSNPNIDLPSREYFLRDPGAAVREDGFHSYLAKFIKWDIPKVAKYNNTFSPLYMELLVPLFYIEQSGGWSRIQATTPKFFQIREPEKRAIEFLLALDSYGREIELQELYMKREKVKSDWKYQINECRTLAQTLGGDISGIPANPTSSWPLEVSPVIDIASNGKWISLHESIDIFCSKLKESENKEIPEVQEISEDAKIQLDNLLNELKAKELFYSDLLETVNQEKAQLDAIDTRIKILDEDYKKNLDVKKLRDYGAPDTKKLHSGHCPTCNQILEDTLLNQIQSTPVMGIEENIAFIKGQINTFQKMKENINRSFTAKNKQLHASSETMADLRSEIRALKQTLIMDNRAPSLHDIRKKVVLQDKIERYQRIDEAFEIKLELFDKLSKEWKDVQANLKRIGKDLLSNTDKIKLNRLQALFLEQEKQFGFSSIPVNTLRVSAEDYHPNREGFDLVFDISASDNIRTIAAYVISLLELSRGQEYETNHPGLLILDEPRQQSLKWGSFKEVLERANLSKEYNQQVILATSEEESNLKDVLAKLDSQYIPFENYILKPLKE